ncbi:MAG: methionine gamma-lyase family protein [Defluviitaleaceae bacterium]|nr:methionine gamma-lyase family protein [Defluviitaleaceae bacterium]
MYEYLTNHMGIKPHVASLVAETEKELSAAFARADEVCAVNQMRVLKAMQEARLSESHFGDSTGYGYHDEGRAVLEKIYANLFHAEAALVRPQLISGTHALAAALFGNLRPRDVLYSPAGKPYDTLESVIGIRAASGSLAEYGVSYRQTELIDGERFDYEAIGAELENAPKMVALQRSKGYSWRKSFTVKELGELIAFIRKKSPQTIILVDNCYGEFVDEHEPTEADLLAGSLIKNPGGGISAGGGYIVGKRELVERSAERLTAPGLGSAVGPAFGMSRNLLQGLFLAPQTVAAAVKGAILAAAVFSKAGFETNPRTFDERSDIVQAIRLNTAENVLAFCKGVQKAAPVDCFVTPEPWQMPGYSHGVVMAGGTFIQGSSIELSADAPMREPYIVYFQGGLTAAHSRAGVVFALQELDNAV